MGHRASPPGQAAAAEDEHSRPTRKRDSATTRDAILHAAGHRFARAGYMHVTLKEIGDDVGITPAMIVRYFGSKRALFRAVAHDHAGFREYRPAGTDSDARNLARSLVEYWQDQDARWTAMALIRSADADEAVPLLRAEIRRRIVEPWLETMTGDDLQLRGQLIAGLSMGFGLFSLGLFLDPDSPRLSPDDAEVAARYLTAMLTVCIDGAR